MGNDGPVHKYAQMDTNGDGVVAMRDERSEGRLRRCGGIWGGRRGGGIWGGGC
jgi:hypothetical protein